MLKNLTIATVAMCMATGSMTAVPVDAAGTTPRAKTQRAAIFACKKAAGIGGQTKIKSGFLSSPGLGTNVRVVIVPHDQVDADAAARINACAARSLGLAPVRDANYDDVSSRPVTNQHYGGKYGAGSLGARTGASQGSIGCPPNFYGLYRGNLYCLRSR